MNMKQNALMRTLAAIVASVVLNCVTAAAEPTSHYELVQHVLETHVLPRVEILKTNAALLPDAAKRVCESGDDASREELGSAFHSTIESWAAVEFLRFGPMTDAGLRERMSFWPDPRGIMTRQLRQVMAAKDEKILENGSIAKQSASVQGLPALEVLLTDKDLPIGPGDASAYRCKFAIAIANNVASIAAEFAEGWTKVGGWKDKMLRPGSDNDTYKEPAEAASELVKALLIGLQVTADNQVKPRLDANSTFAGPYAKSGLAQEYFKASIASLQQLYDVMNLESYLPDDKNWVKNWAGGAWRTMVASDGAGGHVAGVANEDAPPVRKVFDMISGLRKLVAGQMSVAAGLTVGFNELDGD